MTATLHAIRREILTAIRQRVCKPVPSCVCRKCGQSGIFIRERPFADGSGKVFMCATPKCENEGLYFYPTVHWASAAKEGMTK